MKLLLSTALCLCFWRLASGGDLVDVQLQELRLGQDISLIAKKQQLNKKKQIVSQTPLANFS
ncbi:hypothetical protein Tcan_17931 [Toxocara canis]|uniref:Uncharacterized protein n=1 Tax=Toxocara canis TaxID=6265 RepID=A0A0B2W288_TOXCA|nr:hypothetical protein Tcan_17931 [Toxocara canis]